MIEPRDDEHGERDEAVHRERVGGDAPVVAGDRCQRRLGKVTPTVPAHLHVVHEVEPEHGEQEARTGRDERVHRPSLAYRRRAMADEVSGRDVLLEVLRTEGVRHVFGNPGSTELPLIDALAGVDDIHYVLALQEATAVGMADGYAQATGRPAFLNLHTSAGLGNAIGNLTNAQGQRHAAGRHRRAAGRAPPRRRPAAVRARSPTSPRRREVGPRGPHPRRARHDPAPGVPRRRQGPAGPVFVSLRMDLLERRARRRGRRAPALDDRARRRRRRPRGAGRPARQPAVGRVAIVAGDEVAAAGAQAALAAVAEALGAPVFGAPLHDREVFDPPPPAAGPGCWRRRRPRSAPRSPGFERVLLVGGQAFLVYPYSPGLAACPRAPSSLHLSPDPGPLGRAHPVATRRSPAACGASLAALLPLVRARADAAAAADAVADGRGAAGRRSTGSRRRPSTATAPRRCTRWPPPTRSCGRCPRAPPWSTRPSPPASTSAASTTGPSRTATSSARAAASAGACRPPAASRSPATARRCSASSATARPCTRRRRCGPRPASGCPVVFAVVDNGQYRILKDYLRGMGGVSATTGRFVGHGPRAPRRLRRAGRVDGRAGDTRSSTPTTSATPCRAALDAGGPHLLHLPITAP